MSPIRKNWQLNAATTKRFAILLGIAATLFFTYLIDLYVKSLHQEEIKIFYAMVFSIAITIVALIRRLVKIYLSKSIYIEANFLVIPRLFFKDKCINVRTIKKLDIFQTKNCSKAISIIGEPRLKIIVSAYSFHSQKHFDDFVSYLSSKLAKQLNSVGDSKISMSLTDQISSHKISTIVAVLLAISYCICSQELGTLDQTVLELGGITKNVSSFNESYRLYTAFFLHHSLPHLALNLIALGVFCSPLELVIGKYRVINTMLGSALVGSLSSALISSYDLVVGASGGILGLMGGYTVLHLKYSRNLMGSIFVPRNTLFAGIFMQILCDIFLENIDLASHFFGFVTGAAYIAVACHRRPFLTASKSSRFERLGSVLLVSAFSCGIVWFILRYMSL